jgi:hypothetical protein
MSLPRISVAKPLRQYRVSATAFHVNLEDLPRIGVAKPSRKSSGAVGQQ